MSNHHRPRPWLPHTIRRLSLPILLFWVGVAAITNAAVPQLEVVGEAHNVAQSSPDDLSLQAMKRIGKVFHEFDSDSAAMIVLKAISRSATTPTGSTTPCSATFQTTPNTSSTFRTSGAIR